MLTLLLSLARRLLPPPAFALQLTMIGLRAPLAPAVRRGVCSTDRMSNERQQVGIEGESLACTELESLGYHIIERRYRSRFGEIDIVADDAGTIVFVEVKTKTNDSFGDPVEEVTPQKQRQIASMGQEYATYCCPPNTPCRFDVVTVDLSVRPAKITVYQDAFRPGW